MASKAPSGDGAQRKPRSTSKNGTRRRREVEPEQPRTRGGWVPVGTSAERRSAHSERGTKRGERTRRQIIDAARRVFERGDYLSVGVADIAREAGVAHGSFYTYFSSKLDVFRVICAEVAEAVDASVRPPRDTHESDPVKALRESNRRYVETYRANARIYAMMSRLEHVDQDLLRSDRIRQRKHFARIADQIRRWQARGVADPTVDPDATATALVLAIANVCYWLFEQYEGDEPADIERYVETVNDVWVRAVGLRRTPNRRWLAARASD